MFLFFFKILPHIQRVEWRERYHYCTVPFIELFTAQTMFVYQYICGPGKVGTVFIHNAARGDEKNGRVTTRGHKCGCIVAVGLKYQYVLVQPVDPGSSVGTS